MLVVVAIATGLLVWHWTRASQAHQAIRSRRAQIRGLWVEVRTFALRGIFMVIACIIVIFVALKHLADDSRAVVRGSPSP